MMEEIKGIQTIKHLNLSKKDFVNGEFQEVIDQFESDKSKVEKLIFCSGKVFYDLEEKRHQMKNSTVAIVRIEQLYPLPEENVKKILDKYNKTKRIIWLQEEPANAGALSYIAQHLKIPSLEFITRPASATPATGFHKHHHQEQEQILDKAFN